MRRVSRPHAIVPDDLPAGFGSGQAVRDRLRDAGATASAAVPVERARVRLRDGRADVLVRADETDLGLGRVAAAHGVPRLLVASDDARDASAATVIRDSGPDPVARLVAAVHELAADAPARAGAAPTSADSAAGGDAAAGTGDRRMPPSADRVLDEAPVGITVSDVTQPDEPLVYVNDQFVEQTGYDRAEAIGRNCRFLQGPATDPEPVSRMREAIDNGESATVELQNYRKNGERFWQEVSLAPVRNESGEVTHFAGFQADVTRRKRAEQASERHRALLAAERETLQSLLSRLDGVVEQVTRAVVEADTRDGLGDAVTDRLGESYAAAWVGTYDPARERVEPDWSAAPDLDENPGESLGPVTIDAPAGDGISPDGGTSVADTNEPTPRPEPDLLAAAVREGSVVTESGVGWGDDVGAVAAVPVSYQETLFGLLCVYTSEGRTFDREEPAVLASVGRTVGIGLHSIDSHASLVTDGAVEVEFAVGAAATPLVALAERADCRLQQAGVVPTDEGRRVLCTTPGATVEAVREAADRVEGVESWHCLAEREQVPLFSFDLSAFPLLDTVADFGLELADLRVDGDGATVLARGAREAAARDLVETLESQYERVDLRGFREQPAPPETLTEFVVDVEERLTDRQRRALVAANAAGYFEWPRETDGDELAEQFGVARSTFHQHLRAALRKLVRAFDEAVDTGGRPGEP